MTLTVDQSGTGWAEVVPFPLDRVRRADAENDPDDSRAEGTVYYLRTRVFALAVPDGDVIQLPPAA